MAGIPHDHYEPKTAPERWLHRRLPVLGLIYDTIMIPTPKNLNWWWIWGIVLAFCLALQIATGVVLVMHYTPHVDLAFASVEHIMRDVNGGYMLRYLHANGASLFFFAVYIHIFRGLYYGSYKAPREVTWIVGMLIYLMMMGTAFMVLLPESMQWLTDALAGSAIDRALDLSNSPSGAARAVGRHSAAMSQRTSICVASATEWATELTTSGR